MGSTRGAAGATGRRRAAETPIRPTTRKPRPGLDARCSPPTPSRWSARPGTRRSGAGGSSSTPSRAGFCRALYGVNPMTHDLGLPGVTTVPRTRRHRDADRPGRHRQARVAVPDVLAECVAVGARTVLVTAAGFGELGGEHLSAEGELRSARSGRRASGCSGPNTFGLFVAGHGVDLTPREHIPAGSGRAAQPVRQRRGGHVRAGPAGWHRLLRLRRRGQPGGCRPRRAAGVLRPRPGLARDRAVCRGAARVRGGLPGWPGWRPAARPASPWWCSRPGCPGVLPPRSPLIPARWPRTGGSGRRCWPTRSGPGHLHPGPRGHARCRVRRGRHGGRVILTDGGGDSVMAIDSLTANGLSPGELSARPRRNSR